MAYALHPSSHCTYQNRIDEPHKNKNINKLWKVKLKVKLLHALFLILFERIQKPYSLHLQLGWVPIVKKYPWIRIRLEEETQNNNLPLLLYSQLQFEWWKRVQLIRTGAATPSAPQPLRCLLGTKRCHCLYLFSLMLVRVLGFLTFYFIIIIKFFIYAQ